MEAGSQELASVVWCIIISILYFDNDFFSFSCLLLQFFCIFGAIKMKTF